MAENSPAIYRWETKQPTAWSAQRTGEGKGNAPLLCFSIISTVRFRDFGVNGSWSQRWIAGLFSRRPLRGRRRYFV